MAESRGVVYVKWGDGVEALLQRSIASVKQFHPELGVHIHSLPPTGTVLDKAMMFDVSPFEQTLFLDVDTVVLGRLDFAFERAERFGWCCAICENPWARKNGGLKGDLVEYNSGVMFFTRKAEPLFRAWAKCVYAIDSSVRFVQPQGGLAIMPHSDQAGLTQAVEETGLLPFVLPLNWNFRPRWQLSFFGPIKIWHDYAEVPPALVEWNRNQSAAASVIQYNQRR